MTIKLVAMLLLGSLGSIACAREDCRRDPRDDRSCDAVRDEVCGCDGQTYSNACEAEARNVAIDYNTQCVTSLLDAG